MWTYIKRDKRFWISIGFLLILVLLNVGNTIWNDGQIREVTLQYDAVLLFASVFLGIIWLYFIL